MDEDIKNLIRKTFTETELTLLNKIPVRIGWRQPSIKTTLIDDYQKCLKLGFEPIEIFTHVALLETSLCENGARELQSRLRVLYTLLVSDKLSYEKISEILYTTVTMVKNDLLRFTPYINSLLKTNPERMLLSVKTRTN